LFARAPRELVRTNQRMRVFQPVDTQIAARIRTGGRACSGGPGRRDGVQCTYSCTGHSIISQSDRACAIPHGRSSRRGGAECAANHIPLAIGVSTTRPLLCLIAEIAAIATLSTGGHEQRRKRGRRLVVFRIG
jgi:hypothetical protein